MFKFDVYFRNFEVINYLFTWHHIRHSLNIKINKKLHLFVQKGARC